MVNVHPKSMKIILVNDCMIGNAPLWVGHNPQDPSESFNIDDYDYGWNTDKVTSVPGLDP